MQTIFGIHYGLGNAVTEAAQTHPDAQSSILVKILKKKKWQTVRAAAIRVTAEIFSNLPEEKLNEVLTSGPNTRLVE